VFIVLHPYLTADGLGLAFINMRSGITS